MTSESEIIDYQHFFWEGPVCFTTVSWSPHCVVGALRMGPMT